MAELVCVGCGPGDPELLTVKAVNAINAADTIMCPASNEDRPSIALSIVSDIIDKSKNQEIVRLIFPRLRFCGRQYCNWISCKHHSSCRRLSAL